VVATLCTPFLAHTWWPCVDGPADKLDSVHLWITIPDTSYDGHPLYAASNGELVDIESRREGWVTFEWHENYPVVPYYVSVSITNYAIFTHFYHHDSDSMPVPYYVFPEDSASASETFEETVDMIEFFAGIFGEYPFIEEKYSMAEIGFYGAIENQTKSIMGGVSPGWYMIVVHELAHMWFGDMISPTSWHHCWVNEGFASYSEALWWEYLYGHEAYHNYMEGLQYWSGGTIYLENVSDPFSVFLSICYDKGAWVLHMLRGVLGDSVFFDALRAYATDPELMYGNSSTEHVQDVFEAVAGMELDLFFDQWIYDEYFPWYYYWWTYGERENRNTYEVLVTIEQIQGQMGRRPVFVMPIDLVFHLPDRDTTVTVWSDDTLETYLFEFDQRPSDLELDPEEWILRYATEIDVEETERPSIQENRPMALRCAPNPFSGVARIECILPKAQHLILRLYDSSGRGVAQFDRGFREAGNHHISLDLTGFPVGVYFIEANRQAPKRLIKVH
jgi:aminopeptidase N